MNINCVNKRKMDELNCKTELCNNNNNNVEMATTNSLKSKPQMSASSSMEKCDTTPENSRKCDESPEFVDLKDLNVGVMGAEGQNVTMATKNNDSLHNKEDIVQYRNKHVNRSISLQQMHIPVNRQRKEAEVVESKEESSPDDSVRNALAFTIDFGAGKVDQTRHEKMLERFQNRHKRGVSLSKLESSPSSPSPITGNMSSSVRAKTPQSVHLPRKTKLQMDTSECSFSSDLDDKSQVRLRDKHSLTRDTSSKRHSWSPRTSIAEKNQSGSPRTSVAEKTVQNPSSKFTPKSTTLMMAMESQKQNSSPTEQYSSSEFNAESMNSSINLPCIEPPLGNYPKNGNDGDSVSETGTYTLDGDNYTEEQKERMNIDKLFGPTNLPIAKPNLPVISPLPIKAPQRPKNFHEELEVIDLEKHEMPASSSPSMGNNTNERRKQNILEVSYYHEPELIGSKSKQSYLEKLKSRVKDIGRKSRSPDKSTATPNDQGMFTSVTTSGVLSTKVKPVVNPVHPKMGRKNSLTQSHIDSSEYVQGVSKLNIHKNDHDDEKILNVYNEEGSALKNASTKKDWIQEWAKNAREYSKNTKNAQPKISTMTRSYDFGSSLNYDYDIDMTKSDYYDSKKYDEFGDNLDKQHLHRKHLDRLRNNNNEYSSDPTFQIDEFTRSRARYRNLDYDGSKTVAKPPMSPCKIPSPINSIGRARSVSRNRSLQGSNSDLSANDTEMYLHKTAVAISTLQNLHRRNSMRSSSCRSSPLSPSPRRISPKISPMNSMQSPVHHQILYSPQHQQLRNMKNLINHKRNLSLDSAAETYPTQMNNYIADFNAKKNHTRHNSFEGIMSSSTGHSHLPPKPIKCFQHFDQTPIPFPSNVNYNDYDDAVDDDDNIGVGLDDDDNLIVITNTQTKKKPAIQVKQIKQTPQPTSSPIKRSSSFSVKQLQPSQLSLTPKMGAKNNLKIQKSASSNSFNKIMTSYTNNNDYYMNHDDENMEPEPDYSTDSDFSENENDAVVAAEEEKEPITNTRYNKTFLMRMEQNKKIAAGVKQGLAACPNTPEMPRRQIPARARASMPRDSSLNRMKQDLQISRKQVVQKETSTGGQSPVTVQGANKGKVQPKYMDISKYKPQTAPTFLKKDESKSYLKEVVRKSPSSASVALSRTEPGRASTRSVKSAGAKAAAIAKKDAQAKAKEQELEMWRRRSSYNPMQAALEGKKKQEEARRQAQHQQDRLSKSNESTVLRSQSYHSGVVGLAGAGRLYQGTVNNCSNVNLRSVYNQSPNHQNRWTLTSTESSDDLDDDYTIH